MKPKKSQVRCLGISHGKQCQNTAGKDGVCRLHRSQPTATKTREILECKYCESYNDGYDDGYVDGYEDAVGGFTVDPSPVAKHPWHWN